jgi:hypothetical protein
MRETETDTHTHMYTYKGRHVPKDEHSRLLQLGAPQPAITNPQGTLMAPKLYQNISNSVFSVPGGCVVLLIRLYSKPLRERARVLSLSFKRLISFFLCNKAQIYHQKKREKNTKTYTTISLNMISFLSGNVSL